MEEDEDITNLDRIQDTKERITGSALGALGGTFQIVNPLNVKVTPIYGNLKTEPVSSDSLPSNGLCHSAYETTQDLHHQNPYDGTVRNRMAVFPSKVTYLPSIKCCQRSHLTSGTPPVIFDSSEINLFKSGANVPVGTGRVKDQPSKVN